MTVLLQCGHQKPDKTAQQGEAYCGRCFGVFRVIRHIGEYNVSCLRCKFWARQGSDYVTAVRVATKHQTATGHSIRVGHEILRPTGQLALFDL